MAVVDGVIGVDIDDLPALAHTALTADRDLVLDRPAVLEQTGEAGVD